MYFHKGRVILMAVCALASVVSVDLSYAQNITTAGDEKYKEFAKIIGKKIKMQEFPSPDNDESTSYTNAVFASRGLGWTLVMPSWKNSLWKNVNEIHNICAHLGGALMQIKPWQGNGYKFGLIMPGQEDGIAAVNQYINFVGSKYFGKYECSMPDSTGYIYDVAMLSMSDIAVRAISKKEYDDRASVAREAWRVEQNKQKIADEIRASHKAKIDAMTVELRKNLKIGDVGTVNGSCVLVVDLRRPIVQVQDGSTLRWVQISQLNAYLYRVKDAPKDAFDFEVCGAVINREP